MQEAFSPIEINYKYIFSFRRSVLVTIYTILGAAILNFYEPIYSNYLLSIGMNPEHIGYFNSLRFIGTGLGTPIFGYIALKMNKVFLNQVALTATIFSLLAFGPSEILGFPHDSITLIIIGNVFAGFS